MALLADGHAEDQLGALWLGLNAVVLWLAGAAPMPGEEPTTQLVTRLLEVELRADLAPSSMSTPL